jgi:aconitate hydratase
LFLFLYNQFQDVKKELKMNKNNYLKTFEIKGKTHYYYKLSALKDRGFDTDRLPFSIKILVENILRKLDGRVVTETDLDAIAGWKGTYDEPVNIPYHPARVLMQDFTGVPAIVDFASMRDAVNAKGKNPAAINPLVRVDLVVDHSIQVDYFGTKDALDKNVAKEYERNGERYALLKWAQKSFSNFNIVPPNSGICHQVNLEHLSKVVMVEEIDGKPAAFPDTLVGTDSHTTMINGIGVMGWGVGGIEAEAVILGQPYFMSIPEVIGVKLTGRLKPGVTTTDLVLTVTEMLRKQKVVEKFVEYFGPGIKGLTVPDRATLSNMSPEYGATMGFFPVDEKTVEYMRLTGRENEADVVEAYTKANGFFYSGEQDPEYTKVLELDLSTVEPSLAGPARPQDRVVLGGMKQSIDTILMNREEKGKKSVRIDLDREEVTLSDGSTVIAAITSCTNTSNPFLMLGAGLVAKKAVEKGLKVPSYVKTSFAPGSKVVVDYLTHSGLMGYLEVLGFHLTAFGCTTCIGNSGPLHPAIEKAITDHNLTAASVLSGNRNFEARIHQKVRANYLASPMLVVAFALAGRVDLDMTTEPLGRNKDGGNVFLRDIWPDAADLEEYINRFVEKRFFETQYAAIFDGDEHWKKLPVAEGTVFAWDESSTYIRRAPFFEGFSLEETVPVDIRGARVLLVLGDSITTDHISPAGGIPSAYPAGRYLMERGIRPVDFNSYGSRRGNSDVMTRGTFSNVRIKNRLVHPKEGGFTLKFPEREEMYVFEAAERYKEEGVPLIVLGGKEYGTGSSRDWAAKGSLLLGVRAIIAESFERIHRSNLVGMGVLPLVFKEGESVGTLGLDGSEVFDISGIEDLSPRKVLQVKALRSDGTSFEFEVIVRLDNEIEIDYFRSGGILHHVLKQILS